MVILGIETTCDETSVGIVENGRKVLANVVSTSIQLHKKYGGIVPEVAAREQVKLIVPVIAQACQESKINLDDIDAIAVSHGPGLVGSLLIGVEAAKTLALSLDSPLIAINHLVGHVYANWLKDEGSQLTQRKIISLPQFPIVAMIVSGGHTDLIFMKYHSDYQLLGSTRDDAAGEVFDKVARVLGLPYPGGPEIERIAKLGGEINFPRPMISENNFDFSFAGLKTSVVNFVKDSLFRVRSKEAIAYEFQKAIVDILVTKTLKAAKKYQARSIVVGGGVAANNFLRSQLTAQGSLLKIPIYSPSKTLSVDNGAMIAAAAFYEKNFVDPLKLQANTQLHF